MTSNPPGACYGQPNNKTSCSNPSSIMIGDLTTTMPPPVQAPPLISRRALALFGTIAVLWTVLAWFAIEQQLLAARCNVRLR